MNRLADSTANIYAHPFVVSNTVRDIEINIYHINSLQKDVALNINEKSFLTLSYIWRRSDAHRITDIRYEDYKNSLNNYLGYSLRRQDETEQEPNSKAAPNQCLDACVPRAI